MERKNAKKTMYDLSQSSESINDGPKNKKKQHTHTQTQYIFYIERKPDVCFLFFFSSK